MASEVQPWGAGGHPQYQHLSVRTASGSDGRKVLRRTRAVLVAFYGWALRALEANSSAVTLTWSTMLQIRRRGSPAPGYAAGVPGAGGHRRRPRQRAAGEARLNLFLGHLRTHTPGTGYDHGINLIPEAPNGNDCAASGPSCGGGCRLCRVPGDLAERAPRGGAAGLSGRAWAFVARRRAPLLKCSRCGNICRAAFPPVCPGCRAKARSERLRRLPYAQESVGPLPLRRGRFVHWVPSQVEAMPRQVVGGVR